MRARLLLVAVASLLFGCGTLTFERQYDARAREVIATRVQHLAGEIKEELEEPTPEMAPLLESLAEIQALEESQITRSKIAQIDHGKSETEPKIPSDEDDDHVVLYAGAAAHRRDMRELPAKIGKAVIEGTGRVLRAVIPAPIWWTIYGLGGLIAVCIAITIVLYFKGRFWKRATVESIDRFGRLPAEQRKSLTASAHTLGQAYERVSR
jgi:hypothetical protein